VKKPHITGRELRRETPEETLAPGESLTARKSSGKRFELTRVDAGPKSMNAGRDRLLIDMPLEGGRSRTDLHASLSRTGNDCVLRHQFS
jgi:hypothetical protein